MGQPQPGNSSAVQNYTQQYAYDAAGNILSLQHIAGTGSYTRTYAVDTASNRLHSTTVGSNTYGYTHDARGNMLTMPHLQAMGWNALNELYTITQGTTVASYQYSGGQRLRKYVDKGSIKEERIYLGSYEIYRKFDHTGSLTIERTTVHISDDTGRIAMLETRTQGNASDDNNTAETLTRYIYSNHLQSASLELDESAEIISYEEYHPYGTTAYQAVNAAINAVAKRYRYTGKERDEESGLYYHGARYYAPWLCRWLACDPLESKYAGMSPYNYCGCNPIKRIDPNGTSWWTIVHTLPEVVITGTLPEGAKQEKTYTGVVGGTSFSRQYNYYYHRGGPQRPYIGSADEGGSATAKGWYGEHEYVRINERVMLGMIAMAAPQVFHSGISEQNMQQDLQQYKEAAYDFIKRNNGNISSSFFSLLQDHAGELVREFNRTHQEGLEQSINPISDILPGIALGLVKSFAQIATTEIESSVANMSRLSLQLTEKTVISNIDNALSEIAAQNRYAFGVGNFAENLAVKINAKHLMKFAGDWKTEFRNIASSSLSELHFDLTDLTQNENLTFSEFSSILSKPVSNTQWELSTLYNEYNAKFNEATFYYKGNTYVGKEIFQALH